LIHTHIPHCRTDPAVIVEERAKLTAAAERAEEEAKSPALERKWEEDGFKTATININE